MMDPSSSLQIPDMSAPGPSSRQYRPVSVQPTTSSPQPSSRKRASHSVATSNQQSQEKAEDQPAYHDVYTHPVAIAYANAHPRRTIPKFGPYLLLQTLGEGEFGKVKLGLHSQWGEEVAVKLIRRGNIDTTVRMSKVEREIEVLRTLKHPNIVRLYDVIETDKYIGIILEYASGGELFDHILAHRYLKERDAAKLFSQLISGVWYIHQKKIVHRDLKLENLLLDRHRNVIITDFGFANRFEHRSDDLMQTSCGSPCYAAPELVISEGLYVGSAVDIWSCGVILYAMLAGYLPFDDDPANPDGDNINLLYKYIVNTPLSFPDYITPEARDLLSMMLVPDPTRRADLQTIMSHEWLAPFAHVFARQVDELERAAMEQHQMKRLAYQKQMKQAAAAAAEANNKVVRTQSARADVFPASSAPANRSVSYKSPQQPEYLYETSVDQSMNSPYSAPVIPSNARRGNPTTIIPTAASLDDDPFAPSPSHEIPNSSIPIHVSVSAVDEVEARGRADQRQRKNSKEKGLVPAAITPKSSPETAKKKGAFRHTIQVEYGDPDVQDASSTPSQSPPKAAPTARKQVPAVAAKSTEEQRSSRVRTVSHDSPSATKRRPSGDETANGKPLPSAPSPPTRKNMERATPPPQLSDGAVITQKAAPIVSIAAATPSSATPHTSEADRSMQSQIKRGTGSTGSRSSRHSGKHHRGLSVDKLGFGKIFGSAPSVEHVHANGVPSRVPSDGSAADDKPSSNAPTESSNGSLVNTVEPTVKKNRRNTLTVMVEPFRQTIKGRKGKAIVAETPTTEKEVPLSAMQPPATPAYGNGSKTNVGISMGIPASTNKANKVMQWFRSRSKGPADHPSTPTDEPPSDQQADQSKEQVPATPTQNTYKNGPSSSTATINQDKERSPRAPQRTASNATDASFSTPTLADRVRRSVGVAAPTPAKGVLRIHHGPLDHSTITTRPPPEVMKHVRQVLEGMGMDIRLESEFKYRCIRLKKKRTGTGVGLGLRDVGSGNGLAAFNMMGSAASNGVDKRGLPVPSTSSFGSTGGMLKGLLMRRQSSQVSTSGMGSQPSLTLDDDTSPTASPLVAESSTSAPQEPLYGDSAQDAGDEVRFSVELTRLDRLNDTFSLDIRRLKGNLRSYKFLYDTLRERADLQR